MSEKVISDLAVEFVAPLPADLKLSAHSAATGQTGKVASSLLGGGTSGPPLSNANPQPLGGNANPGVSTDASRADHVHLRPTAAQITNTPAGNIGSTTVQGALNELDGEKIATNTRGVANGVATLDAAMLIPIAQIPQLPATKTDVAATGNIVAGNLQSTIAGLDTRISALTQSLTLAGTYNAATNVVDAIEGQGLVDGALPVPAAGNANRYLIVNTGGTGIGNAAGLGTIEQGNWIYSTGSAWVELVINSQSVAANQVTSTPAGTLAATNVQAALNELDTEKVATTRLISGANSVTGGGSLASDQTLQLVGDLANPGTNRVYGTDAAGNKGWKPDPAGGGTTVELPFLFRASSPPLVTPAAKFYLSGIAANGVQYPVYEFSGAADNFVDLFGYVPHNYANGNITISLPFCSPSGTGQITWGAAICNLSGTFAVNAAFTFTFVQTTVAAPGTVFVTGVAQITMTRAQASNMTAGQPIVLRIRRLGSDSSTAVAYLQHFGIQVVEVV